MCVAMYRWVCRSIVNWFVRFVRSAGALGLVPRCMYQSGWGGVFVQVHWVFPGWVIVVDGQVGIGGGDVY